MIKSRFPLAALALFILCWPCSLSAEQITPAGASASSIFTMDQHPLLAVNGAGMGQLNGTSQDPTGTAHTNHVDYVCTAGPCVSGAIGNREHVPNHWLTDAETALGYIEVDLGQNYPLGSDALKIWNYNHTIFPKRGMRQISIETLPDDGSAVLDCTFPPDGCTHPNTAANYMEVPITIRDHTGAVKEIQELSKAPGNSNTTGNEWPIYNYNTPDTVDFNEERTARFIRITALSPNPTHDSDGYMGLAEIQVFSAASAGPVTYTWQGNSGDWASQGNWSGVGFPSTAEDSVVFGQGGGLQTVFSNGPVTINRIEFNSAQSYNIAAPSSVGLSLQRGLDEALPATGVAVTEGTHEFQAVVDLGSDAAVDVASGSSLVFNNAINLNGFQLNKTGTGTLTFNNLSSSGVGTVAGLSGIISGSGTLGGDLDNQSATVAPGNSPGVLTIDGNYTQGSGGTLAIEIAGNTPGDQYDRLVVGGQANLAGTLDVTLANFAPSDGDAFDILDFNSVSGDFDSLNLPGGFDWTWDVNTGVLSVGSVVGGLPGDYDGNGIVDAADYTIFQDNFGGDSSVLNGNGSGAATVVQADYLRWKDNFGSSGSANNAAIPEPGSMVLLVLQAGLLGCLRKFR